MRKRTFLAVALGVGLLLSLTGMVSAFEAHTINVTAHVENALEVTAVHINMGKVGTVTGAVFPEEWITKDFQVRVSQSFCAETQLRVEKIDYQVWVTDKPNYLWLGDALYIGKDVADADKFPTIAKPAGGLIPVDNPNSPPSVANLPSTGPNGNPTVNPRPTLVLTGTINKGPETTDCEFNIADTITIGLDVPVFDGYWNRYTDVVGCDPSVATGPKKPSHLCKPSVVLTGNRNHPEGIDLGADLVVQVTKIYKFERCGNGFDDDLDGVIDELPQYDPTHPNDPYNCI